MNECTWTEDAIDGGWDTSCGYKFDIHYGTPKENEMRFCCFCGKPLKEKLAGLDDSHD